MTPAPADPDALADTDPAPTLRMEPVPITLRCPPTERSSWGVRTTIENCLPPSGRGKVPSEKHSS